MVAALTSEDDVTRRLAATALVEQPSQLSLVEVIRQVETLSDDVCAEFAQAPDRLTPVTKQCISQPDPDLRLAAIAFIHRSANFSLFTLLVRLLDHPQAATQSAAADSLRRLAEQFAHVLLGDGAGIPSGMNLDTARTMQQELLSRLDARIAETESMDDPAAIIESLLLLGTPGNDCVRNVLDRRGDECQRLAAVFLKTSSHPAIFELLCGSLDRPFPPLQICDIVQQRADLEFAQFLLDWLSRSLRSRNVLSHLAGFPGLAWLSLDHEVFQSIPPEQHQQLVTLVGALGLKSDERSAIKAWIVRHSDPAGRNAARDVLDNMPAEEVQEILYDALSDEDPHVEAWATKQLRSRRVPDCFPQLLQRLDRETDEVRGAAQSELADFNLDRLLDLFSQLPKSTCLRCGEVLLKIDPGSHLQLREEFRHPYRWRRMRAARAAADLGLVDHVVGGLTELLNDSEATVRRSAVEALAVVRSPATIAAIQSRLDDRSRMVREAAAHAIAVFNAQT